MLFYISFAFDNDDKLRLGFRTNDKLGVPRATSFLLFRCILEQLINLWIIAFLFLDELSLAIANHLSLPRCGAMPRARGFS